MAAANSAFVSSSPPQAILEGPSAKQCVNMSSSPGLPSPSRFFSRKSTQLDSIDGNIPVARDAGSGFVSASTVLRNSPLINLHKVAAPSKEGSENKRQLDNINDEQLSEKQSKPKAAEHTKVRKPKEHQAPRKKSLAAKKPIADIVEAAIIIDSSPDAVVKKTSSTKVKEPSQTRIKKGKVTKATGASPELVVKDSGKSRGKKVGDGTPGATDTLCGESSTRNKATKENDKPFMPEGEKALSEKEPVQLGLDEAAKRRKDWTPVEDTAEGFVSLSSVEATPVSIQDAAARRLPRAQFENLLGDYGFAEINSKASSRPAMSRTSSGEALTKRRRLEVSLSLCL